MATQVIASALLAAILGAAGAEERPVDPPEVYVEFLWSKRVSPLARQQTLGFVMDGKNEHQVCVAVLSPGTQAKGLVMESIDAAGRVVSHQTHAEFSGEKRCYTAEFPGDAQPGTWTYQVYLDGRDTPAGAARIEVARSLEDAPFHAPSMIPYVLGRPNYDPSIPPEAFNGRLVWAMHVDAGGKVVKVDVEVAGGVGELMKERAIEAGFLFLFPPDPARGEGTEIYRRELNFRPDR